MGVVRSMLQLVEWGVVMENGGGELSGINRLGGVVGRGNELACVASLCQ